MRWWHHESWQHQPGEVSQSHLIINPSHLTLTTVNTRFSLVLCIFARVMRDSTGSSSSQLKTIIQLWLLMTSSVLHRRSSSQDQDTADPGHQRRGGGGGVRGV